MEKRWKLKEVEEAKVNLLQEQLKIHPVLCRMLVHRGIETFDEAKSFFRPTLDSLHSPWLMKDMGKAVERIKEAFARREKILVFGDYEVDGTTAVACVYQFLEKLYGPYLIEYYIPHRYREGYGVSKHG